jgi:hypothetical protein
MFKRNVEMAKEEQFVAAKRLARAAKSTHAIFYVKYWQSVKGFTADEICVGQHFNGTGGCRHERASILSLSTQI